MAKLEATATPPAAQVVHIVFPQTHQSADEQIAVKIANGTAKDADKFIIVSFLKPNEGAPPPALEVLS